MTGRHFNPREPGTALRGSAVVVLSLVMPVVAWAQAEAPKLPVGPVSPLPDAGASALRVFGALLVVLALFFAGVWLWKNWQRLAAMQGGRAPKLHILEVKSLGNRQALYVIGYDRQRMLVGSSPTGMTLLTQLPEATDDEMAATASHPGVGFAGMLKSAMEKKG
jgi:flagellar biogenesis protein FliO